MLDIPVVGIAQAAMTTASLLGNRFSLVSISQRMIPLFRVCVERNGMASRLASIRMFERPVRDIAAARVELAAPLVELCQRAADKDGADVVILAGGPLAGLAHRWPVASRCRWSMAWRARSVSRRASLPDAKDDASLWSGRAQGRHSSAFHRASLPCSAVPDSATASGIKRLP